MNESDVILSKLSEQMPPGTQIDIEREFDCRWTFRVRWVAGIVSSHYEGSGDTLAEALAKISLGYQDWLHSHSPNGAPIALSASLGTEGARS